MNAIRDWAESLNVYVAGSTFGRIFRLEGSRHVGCHAMKPFSVTVLT